MCNVECGWFVRAFVSHNTVLAFWCVPLCDCAFFPIPQDPIGWASFFRFRILGVLAVSVTLLSLLSLHTERSEMRLRRVDGSELEYSAGRSKCESGDL